MILERRNYASLFLLKQILDSNQSTIMKAPGKRGCSGVSSKH